ncbi:hypothetical protein GW17_00001963 [Ensete ventricosum]|nr:hypothetical protein GW17_00001963 [Ensete ventricosum]
MIILLPLWLTIPPYAPTMFVVLANRRAFAVGGCRPYLCHVDCTSTGAPRTSGRLPASGRPRQRDSYPRLDSSFPPTRLDSARLYPALGFEIGPTSMETPQKRKPRDAADDEEAEAIKKRRLSDGEGEEDDGSGSLPGLAVYKDEDDEDEEAMVRRERGDDGSNGLGGGRGEPVDNGDHRVGGGGDEEMQEVEDKAAARIPAPVRQQRQVERRRDCPYLDTVNRQVMFLFSKEQVLHLDENRQWSRALDGSNYLPGMGELEVVKEIQTKLLIEKKDNDEEQYNVTVAEGGSSIDNVVREASRVPFLMLGLDLPPPPLFKDAMEKNIIPQVAGAFSPARGDGTSPHMGRKVEATYEMQDLHVTETLPQMVALSEAYMQIYEQQE